MTKKRPFYFVENIRWTTCSSCQVYKDETKFSSAKRWDNLASQCKQCQKEKRDANAEHYRQYRQRNKERRAENHKKWYKANTQYAKDYVVNWRANNKEHMKQYRSNPKILKYRRKWARNKYKHDTTYRVGACLRARLYLSLIHI